MRVSIRVAAIGLTLAACSSGDNNAPGNAAPLTQAEAQVIADEMQSELAAISSGASVSDLMTPSFPAPPGAIRAFNGPIHFGNPPAGCPTLSEYPPTDLDQDGVPDNLTVMFDPTVCVFTRPGGGATMALSGSVSITDLTDPQTQTDGLRLVFDQLQQELTLQSSDFFRRSVDGSWELSSDPQGFAARDNTTVEHSSSRYGSRLLEKQWQVLFTVTDGTTFSRHARLPSGDFTIDGTTNRRKDGLLRSFEVETLEPLHRDITCTADHKIVSGTLRITTTNESRVQTLEIKFNGCGVDPTITLVT